MIYVLYTKTAQFELDLFLKKYRSGLPEEFKNRLDRYLSKKAKINLVVGRLLLEFAIKNYYGKSINVFDSAFIQFNDNKKPYVNGFQFNISHTDGLLILALSKGAELGIDVERKQDVIKSNFKHLFSAQEYNLILKDNTHGVFFDFWTKKEAVLKALGQGMSQLPYISVENLNYLKYNDQKIQFKKITLEDKMYDCTLCTLDENKIEISISEIDLKKLFNPNY